MLNSREVLISKFLTGSYISKDEFILVNNKLKKYDDLKKEIKNLKTLTVHQRFYLEVFKTMLSYCLKRSKNMENKNPMIEKTKNRTIPLSKYAVGGSKKLRFVQEQESSS